MVTQNIRFVEIGWKMRSSNDKKDAYKCFFIGISYYFPVHKNINLRGS